MDEPLTPGPDQPLMTIGTFSRASLLSIRSLRAYHQRGILVPAAIDPSTGYRAYHPGQLPDAVALRRLRELDVPLPTIREILDNRDPEVTTKLLAEHQAEMEARLAETERIVADLQRAVTEPSPDLPVHVRTVDHQHAIAVTDRVSAEDYGAFLGDAYGRLWAGVASRGPVPAGPVGALYGSEVVDGPQPVTAYIPVAEPLPASPVPTDLELLELPAVTVAVAVHEGPYASIDDRYASLGAWVAYHAEPSTEPLREIYLVSYGETTDPERFRTEIQWPIRARREETPR